MNRVHEQREIANTTRLELQHLAGPSVELPASAKASLLIGRAADCDFMLPDSTVSRHHAKLDLAHGLIEDLASSGGTWVNEKAIEKQSIKPGDRVQIGPWIFAVAHAGTQTEGATIVRANLAASLAAPRLELLLEFFERLNQVGCEQDIYSALVTSALAGSGCQQALIVSLTEPGNRVLAQSPEGSEPIQASRQLVSASRSGDVVTLSDFAIDERSDSIQAQQLVSAMAVALISESSPYACLYLHSHEGAQTAQPDAARFCQALARMAELALARLYQQQALWHQREQIYADLHDDLGARLLNQVYRAHDAASADEARAMLADLRDVVSRPTAGSTDLQDLLAEVRAEALTRLDTAGITLTWRMSPLTAAPHWRHRAAALLSRCLRESISNALRHARPSRIAVEIQNKQDRLLITIRHDGQFSHPESWTKGRGTRSLYQRSKALDGQVNWSIENGQLETRFDLALLPSLMESSA